MDIESFQGLLNSHGVHALLQALNSRTPHRYTGIYRFDGELLRSEFLYDQQNPEQLRGSDNLLANTYCALPLSRDETVAFPDARLDARVTQLNGDALSYCGIVIREKSGKPFGTLCHFDPKPCETRFSDIQLLEALAPFLFAKLAA